MIYRIFFIFLLTGVVAQAQLTESHTVYFDVDKDKFSFSEGQQLNSFFDDLLYKPLLDVKILGYCDDRGSYEYNMDLSNRRVETVSEWLQNHRITVEHISKTIEGKGEVALEEEKEMSVQTERAHNRRVDLIFSLKKNIADHIAIDKLNKNQLTEAEKKEIESYEQKVIDAVAENGTLEKVVPTSMITPEEEAPPVVLEEYLDIPTNLDPPIDNTQEPFKTLLKKNLKKGEVIILENILFYKGRSTVLEESQPLLDRVAEILVARKDIHFEIHGHVCCINPVYKDAYNRDTRKSHLSHDRAKAIFNILRKRGVDRRRMSYKGFGRTKPLGGIDKLDRRVELFITKIDPVD